MGPELITSVHGGGPTALQALLWAALLCAAAGVRPVATAAGLSRRQWLALGALVAAGGALRLFAAPATILHDNSHAYTDIALCRSLIVEGTHFYDNGYFTFWSHLFLVLGEDAPATWLLHGNALLDALTAGLVGLLAAVLSRKAEAAGLATALYACLPVAVKVAHTESQFVLGAFLGCLGFLLVAAAARERSWVCAVGGGLVLGYASHVRPELAVLPALTLLLCAWAAPSLRDLAREPFAAVALAVQCAAASPALFRAWRAFTAGEGASDALRLGSLPSAAALTGLGQERELGCLLLNPDFTPPTIPLLAAAGLAVAIRLRARWAPFAALAPAALVLPVLPIQNAEWVAMRLQHGALALACLLPALGLACAPWPWRTPRRAAVLTALCCLAGLPYAPLVRELRAPQREYAFLRSALPLVPDGCVVLSAGHDREIVADLPTWLSAEHGLDHEWKMLDASGEPGVPEAPACVVWYRGTSCYAAPGAGYGAPPGGLRPACAAFEGARDLEDLATASIPGTSDTFYGYSRETLAIGFFRVR